MITEEMKKIIVGTMPHLMNIEGKSKKEIYYGAFSDGYGMSATLEKEETAGRSEKA